MDDYQGDPVARRFDRLVALVAYGLLFISVFTFWLPALLAAAIAFTHRRGADPLTASHFGFQLLIFWVGFGLVALAVLVLLGAGGFAFGAVWTLLVAALSEGSWSWQGGMASAGALTAGAVAGILTLTALVMIGLASLWTLLSSAWGVFRLAGQRPIGQSVARRDLEFR